MVLQKRLNYGFNGYQVPAMPRSSRSARGRGSLKRKVEEDNHMCAFELLATVAGKLLLERESSPASSNVSAGRAQYTIVKHINKQEKDEEERLLKLVPCDKGSCDESAFFSELGLQVHDQNYILKDLSHAKNDACSGPASLLVSSDLMEKVGCVESEIAKYRTEFGLFPSETEGGCSGCEVSDKGKVEDGIEGQVEADPQKNCRVKNQTVLHTCSSGDLMDLDTKLPALVSSDSSVEVPLCRDPNPRGPYLRCQNDVELDSKDDDDNSSGCAQPCTVTTKVFRALPCAGDHRTRKLLASSYQKVAPKLKDGEFSKSYGDTKPIFCNSNACYTHQQSQRNFPFKRRKQFKQSSGSTSDQGISSENISSSPEEDINPIAVGSGATTHRASGASSSVDSQESSLQTRDSHVKLRIESFRVPELFIDISETSTVDSLKRTVMEAVTEIFGEGLRVDILLQGKKIRDDNKTLLQTGICHDNKLESLGFALEPNPANTPPPLCPEDPPFMRACDVPQQLTRYPTTPMTNLGNCVKSDHNSVAITTDTSMDKSTPDSRALVAIPTMSVDALAVVPTHQKSRRPELVQRRMRRPFSVSEVEALVQAVEKLGTGRWRDVKLHAFDNAKHRTFVDLKDKWKTLVHTARISPQQRRGEPVPQELLDRVLSVHSHWSQHQATQQIKQQTERCLIV